MSAEDAYSRILECLTRGDVKCLTELATTPEFKEILTELERRGIRASDALVAVATSGIPKLEPEATLEDYEKAVELAELVKEGKYVDALKVLVGRPNVVKYLRTGEGKPVEAHELAEQLVFWSIYSQPNTAAEIQQLASKHEMLAYVLTIALRKLAAYRVHELCEEGKHSEALAFVKNLQSALDTRYTKSLKDAVALLLQYSDKLSEQELAELVSLAKQHGIITERHEQTVVEEATKSVEEVVYGTLEQLLKFIGDAVEKKNAEDLNNILRGYDQLLKTLPLVVSRADGTTATVGGTTLYDYLATVYTYLTSVEPLFDALADSVNGLNEGFSRSDADTIAKHSERMLKAVQALSQYANSLAVLRHVASVAKGTGESVEQARREVENELLYYRRLAEYALAVAEVFRACGTQACDTRALAEKLEKLPQFFSDFPEAVQLYASYRLVFTAGLVDLASLFGLVPRTSLVQDLGRYGVTVDALLSGQRDLLAGAVFRAVLTGFFSGDPESASLAKKLLSTAVGRGLDGRLSDLSGLVEASELVAGPLARVNALAERLRRAKPEEYGKLVADFVDAADAAANAVRNAVARYGAHLSKFEVEVGEGATRRRVTVLEAYNLMASALEFSRSVVKLQYDLAEEVARALGSVPSDAGVDKRLEAVRSAQGAVVRAMKTLEDLGRRYDQPVAELMEQLRKLEAYYRHLGDIMMYAQNVEAKIREVLELLRDGLQHPEESGKLASRWGSMVSYLKELRRYHSDPALVRELTSALGSEAGALTQLSSRVYVDYYNYASELKSELVAQDMRLEDILNSGEPGDLRVEYRKPYIQAPVVGALEKYIKIGIKQFSDWLSRIPAVGTTLAGFWEGFAGAVMSLATPYEQWQQIQYISKGAGEFVNKLKSGDVPGAVRVVAEPLYQTVTADPVRFFGSMAGFVTLAIIGKGIATKLASKLKMPGLAKLDALVVNALQVDPLGLVVDYIVGPAIKRGIAAGLAVWGITPGQIGAVARGIMLLPAAGLRKLADVLVPKVYTSLGKLKTLASLVYGWGDDIAKILKNLEDIKDKKGVNYLLALRNSLLELDEQFRASLKQLDDLVKSGKDIRERPVKALAFAAGMDVDRAVKALTELRDAVRTLKVAGVEVDLSKLSNMSLGELEKLRNAVRDAVSEVAESRGKLKESLKTIETKLVQQVFEQLVANAEVRAVLKNVDEVLDNIRKGVAAGDVGVVLDGLIKLVNGLDHVIYAAKNLDMIALASTSLKNVLNMLNELERVIKELKLDEFKPVSKELPKLRQAIDLVSSKLKDVAELEERAKADKTVATLAELASRLGMSDVAEAILKQGLDLTKATDLLLSRFTAKTLSELATSVNNVVKFLDALAGTPQFYALRGFLSNLQVKMSAQVRDALVPNDVVEALKKFRDTHKGLPLDLYGLLNDAIADPKLSKVLAFVNRLVEHLGALDQKKAAAFDLALAKNIVDSVEDVLKKVDNPKFQLPDVSATLEGLSKLRERLAGIRVEKVEVTLKLVDPGLKTMLDQIGTDLKSRHRFLSNYIDNAVSTLKKFLDLVDEGRFDEAWRMYSSVKNSASLLQFLGIVDTLNKKLVEAFTSLKNKLRQALGKEVPDTAEAKAVSAALDELEAFLRKAGVVELKPGYGYLAFGLDEVVGFTMKAPVESLETIKELLTVKLKDYTVTVDGASVRVVREVSKTPTEFRVKYTFETPVGKAFSEVVVRTVEYDPALRRAVNSVLVNNWYDPPLQGTAIAKQLSENLSKGLDFLRRVDPAVDALSRVVTYVPNEITLGSALSKALTALSAAMLGATLAATAVETDKRLAYIYSQPQISTALASIPHLYPVPDQLYSTLDELGIKARGMYGRVVVADLVKPLPPQVQFVEVVLPSGEKLVLPSVDNYVIVSPPLPELKKELEAEKPRVETPPIDWRKLVQVVPEVPTVVVQPYPAEKPAVPEPAPKPPEVAEVSKPVIAPEEEQPKVVPEPVEPRPSYPVVTPTIEPTPAPPVPPLRPVGLAPTGPGMPLPTIPSKNVTTAQLLTIGGGKVVREFLRA